MLPSLATAPDHTGPLPFVASLNERPFDQFGLADRLVAGVVGTQTFAVEPKDAGPTTTRKLRFETYRKEIGPEPRRALDGLDEAASRRVTLHAEGPLGHHFDPDAADAPGFVNSSYLLHLGGTDPDRNVPEMFTQIEMRRLVDPGWSFAPPRTDTAPLPAIWALDLSEIDIPEGTSLNLMHETASDGPAGTNLMAAVSVMAHGDELAVRVSKDAAYADPAAPGAGPAELCRVTPRQAGAHLVLRSLGEDGFEVLILSQALAPGAAAKSISAPQLVAAATYKAGPLKNVVKKGGTSLLGKIRQILMGGATGRTWVKSAYDMTRFCVGDALSGLGAVRAVLDGPSVQFKTPDNHDLRLASRDVFAPEALGVHTHLAAVTLKRAPAKGRTVLVPGATVLLDPIGRGTLPAAVDASQVALMAFESPAEVLRLNARTNEARATFDLDAVAATDDPQTDILLRLRVAGMDLGDEDGLVVSLQAGNWDADRLPSFEVQRDQLDGVSYIDIRLPVGGGQAQPTLYTHDPSGQRIALDPFEIPDITPAAGHLTLGIKGLSRATLDVSMIPALPRGTGAWNWDWVFPPVAGLADGAAPPVLDTSTRPEHMRRQIEAVLAPLGISDPIRVAD